MKQGFPKVSNYKVLVECCTYNQSQYIEDALKGFVMQQTNFPFLCCIFDDASTDGAQKVLKRWVENHCESEKVEVYNHPLTVILMAPDKDNPNCIYAIHLQKVNTWRKPEKIEMVAYWEKQSEYISLCEGDDYWIDPFKLQKQVDFMETHHDYSLCFHNYTQLWPDGSRILISKNISNPLNCSINDAILSGGGYMATNSMLFRTKYIKNYPLWATIGAGDFPLMLILFHLGKVAHLNIVGSVYRVNSIGSWSENMNKISFLLQNSRNSDMMLRCFDKWSNKKYHNIIILKRIKNQLINIKLIFKIYCRKYFNCLK